MRKPTVHTTLRDMLCEDRDRLVAILKRCDVIGSFQNSSRTYVGVLAYAGGRVERGGRAGGVAGRVPFREPFVSVITANRG